MTTYIELEGLGKINVKNGTSFPINFNIQNLLDVNQTPANYSKNVIIVGDKNTNQILGHLYDINVDGTFNVNKKQKCTVYQGGAQILTDVYFQLLSIKKLGDKVEYTGIVKSILMDFFTTIKDKQLTDLSLTKPTNLHNLTKQNVKNTFNNTYVDEYKYITYYRESTVYDIKDFRPAIFLKTYWDAIHKQNGWEYEFDEFNDLHLDKLLIPTTNKYEVSDLFKQEHSVLGLSSTDILNTYNNTSPKIIGNGFILTNSGYLHQNIHNTNIYNLNWTSFTDPDGLINSSNVLIPTFQGEYHINIKFNYRFQFSFSEPAILNTNFANSLVGMHYLNILVERNNGGLELIKTNVLRHFWETGKQYSVGTQVIDNGEVSLDLAVHLGAGDKIIQMMFTYEQAPGDNNGDLIAEVTNQTARWLKQGSPGVGVDYNPQITLSNTQLSIIPQITYDYGTPISLDNFIPRGVSQRDFIKSFIDMYRLVIQVDKEQDNKLIYTTRDKFYDDGKQLDWTDKLDLSRDKNIEWLQDKQNKSLLLTYKEDKDVHNTNYLDKTKYRYGQYDYRFENEYNVGQKVNEVIFSPSPILHNKFSNVYTSALIAEEDYNIRLLYDNGTRTDGWFYWVDEFGENGNLETIYPTALHFDNPNNPAYDLNFGINAFYYYSNFNITNNNIFELYHRRFIGQLSEGRIMTAFFHLTEKDIINLELNEKLWVDNAWWNINKIIDYDANGTSLTKVELVTIDDGIKVKIRRGINGTTIKNPVTGVSGVYTPTPSNPIVWEATSSLIKDIYLKKTISSRPIGGYVIGINNTINGEIGQFDGIVIGTNNTINANNPIVIGNNIQADNDGEMYVNNINLDTINGVPISQFGGISEFTDLDDTPSDYTGEGGKLVRVKNDETGLEFFNIVNNIVDITRADLINLRDNNNLDISVVYKILDSDIDGDFNDYIYVTALTTNLLNETAKRTMRVIKDDFYNNIQPSGINGNGSYGVLKPGLQFGDNAPSFAFVGIFVWGARVWQLVGPILQPFNATLSALPTNNYDANTNVDGLTFTLQPLTNNIYYQTKIFDVKYLIDSNTVVWQEDWKGNKLYTNKYENGTYSPSSIKFNDWGNEKISSNRIVDTNLYPNTSMTWLIINNSNGGDIKNNNCFKIFNNSNVGGIFNNSNVGDIGNNSNVGGIFNNSNVGDIGNNSNVGDIYYNNNGGDIFNNSNVNGIFNNSNVGGIFNNSNGGVIYYNNNGGDIFNNSNVGGIFNNSNVGGIYENSNEGVIYENSNVGDIDFNSNVGGIYDNSNVGGIYNNSNVGGIYENNNGGNISGNFSLNNSQIDNDIYDNSNNGDIYNNRFNISGIHIRNNINNGHIGTFSMTPRQTSVTDTIVNK